MFFFDALLWAWLAGELPKKAQFRDGHRPDVIPRNLWWTHLSGWKIRMHFNRNRCLLVGSSNICFHPDLGAWSNLLPQYFSNGLKPAPNLYHPWKIDPSKMRFLLETSSFRCYNGTKDTELVEGGSFRPDAAHLWDMIFCILRKGIFLKIAVSEPTTWRYLRVTIVDSILFVPIAKTRGSPFKASF